MKATVRCVPSQDKFSIYVEQAQEQIRLHCHFYRMVSASSSCSALSLSNTRRSPCPGIHQQEVSWGAYSRQYGGVNRDKLISFHQEDSAIQGLVVVKKAAPRGNKTCSFQKIKGIVYHIWPHAYLEGVVEKRDLDVKLSHEYVLNLRGQLDDTLQVAREGLQKAQTKRKYYYDRKEILLWRQVVNPSTYGVQQTGYAVERTIQSFGDC
ncbi:hypothetical protein PoB_002202800 [Plakobranchus ocellatus]|uniref:Uncharacterized protein n=1 Tax=Plakobranchus ocellatus TaxID=259542 RepID=A0AAV3ZL01_9GAST|nr:hypothetical protein PoB_002202800 [Plakobranchus ocellatus]